MSEFAVNFLFRILKGEEKKIPKEIILKQLAKHFMFTKESEEYILQQYLFDLCDRKNEQKLDYETFLAFMRCIEIYNSSLKISRNVSTMQAIFSAIDLDNSKSLNKSEIHNATLKFKKYREKSEIFDTTIDAIIRRSVAMTDFEELSMTQFLEIVVKPNEFEEYHYKLYGAMFDRIDVDKSKSIDAKELKILLKEIYPLGIEKKRAEEFVINIFDPLKKQKGTINKNQFIKFITYALGEKGDADYLSKYHFYKTLCKMVDSNKTGMLESEEIEVILRGAGKNERKINKWFETHGGRNKSYHIDDFVKILITKR